MRQRLYASIVTKRVGAIDSVEKAQLLASYVQQFGYDYFELKWTDHALDQQRVVPEQVLVMLLCFNRWNSLENNPMIPNDLQWQIASYLLL